MNEILFSRYYISSLKYENFIIFLTSDPCNFNTRTVVLPGLCICILVVLTGSPLQAFYLWCLSYISFLECQLGRKSSHQRATPTLYCNSLTSDSVYGIIKRRLISFLEYPITLDLYIIESTYSNTCRHVWQNLELEGIEPEPNYIVGITLSNWEHKYSLFLDYLTIFKI